MRPDYRPHFAAIATRYDALRGERADAVLDLLVTAGELAGRSVLDLGCGTGASAAALARRFGCTAMGVDPSAEMLAVARARAPDVTFLEGRAEAIPLPDEAVERVLMQTSVHLVDRPRALAEIHRVLEPGGRVVIATVDPRSPRGVLAGALVPVLGRDRPRALPRPGPAGRRAHRRRLRRDHDARRSPAPALPTRARPRAPAQPLRLVLRPDRRQRVPRGAGPRRARAARDRRHRPRAGAGERRTPGSQP